MFMESAVSEKKSSQKNWEVMSVTVLVEQNVGILAPEENVGVSFFGGGRNFWLLQSNLDFD